MAINFGALGLPLVCRFWGLILESEGLSKWVPDRKRLPWSVAWRKSVGGLAQFDGLGPLLDAQSVQNQSPKAADKWQT
jgi:hypothetical protein